MEEISAGVPQESELGPILFLLRINDLHNALPCKPRLFIDDTLLLRSSKDLEQLEYLCNNERLLVKQWINANKLKINTNKSQAIVINHKLRFSKNDVSLKSDFDHNHIIEELRYFEVLIGEKQFFITYKSVRN